MEDLTAALSSKPTPAGRLDWLIRLPGLIPHEKRKSLFEAIFSSLYQALWGCWHRNISRPFTLWGRTYEVCLDCGKELPYSLEQMSRVKE